MAVALTRDAVPLRERDWRAAMAFVGDMIDAQDDADGFVRCGIAGLQRLAASDLTTLSICDLASGRRDVVSSAAGGIGADAKASFDRHFHQHPLVHHHAVEHGTHAHRISDSIPFARFRETPLYDEYYRRIGIAHAIALPVWVSDRWLVSFVLNRRQCDFSDIERARLDLVRASLQRLFVRLVATRPMPWPGASLEPACTLPRHPALSAREHEVLRWVAAGKTDRDAADILRISVRTVHKHLQSIYAKLGVETRTAAVMRVLGRN
jgi:DNA-binding CsgD family transcriptional regulator